MSTSAILTRAYRPYVRPTLRTITATAILLNGLLFVFDLFANGPNPINLSHIIPSLVFAAIVASRFRWTPALGALISAILLV